MNNVLNKDLMDALELRRAQTVGVNEDYHIDTQTMFSGWSCPGEDD